MYATGLRTGRLVRRSRFTDADPFKVIYVDPTAIEHHATDLPKVWGRVVGGEWETVPFEEDTAYRAMKKRFVDDKEWDEIDERITDPQVWETLYHSIKTEGYKSQAELAASNTTDDLSWDCEIGVAIDADGDIHWVKRGARRIRIAKLLEVEEVPVQVRIRHPQWQEVRDEIRTAESVTALSERARKHLGHPDLQDVCGTLSTNTKSYE
ncbi:hypothetical protein C446_12784 [Halobiforma nitratireducens JCM 10879]|uniref:ParB-like nuclease n=1 Tax=Halobiforma nitratireducens JCM 10879 TaxID=1227454 RepID=M0LSD1_9EURY|nr:hypothetical protein C446_12784 [Halobiforma nitratireducens JCM 10879]